MARLGKVRKVQSFMKVLIIPKSNLKIIFFDHDWGKRVNDPDMNKYSADKLKWNLARLGKVRQGSKFYEGADNTKVKLKNEIFDHDWGTKSEWPGLGRHK